MIVDEHIHLGGPFNDLNFFVSCLEKAGVDFVLATPYMFEKSNIPIPLMCKNIPPWLAGNVFVKCMITKIMKNKNFNKRYIKIPENNYIAKMVEVYPGKIYGVYWINPNMESIVEIEDYILSNNFVAIKLHQVIYPCSLDDKIEIFNVASKNELPIFIHTDNLKEVEFIVNHAKKDSNLNIIFAHLNFFEEIADEIAKFDNISFDISPLFAHKDKKILNAISKIGSKRLIFGSDSPCPGHQKYAVERIKKLKIPQEDKEMILGKNIINIIKKRLKHL